jgi:hypothetical protein
MTPRAAFLASRTKCPACGASRYALSTESRARFECGLAVGLRDGGEFVLSSPCLDRSQRLVRHWNQQTEKLSHETTPNERL